MLFVVFVVFVTPERNCESGRAILHGKILALRESINSSSHFLPLLYKLQLSGQWEPTKSLLSISLALIITHVGIISQVQFQFKHFLFS